MKAFLILDGKVNKSTKSILDKLPLGSIVILTDKWIYDKFESENKDYQYFLIDIFAEENNEEKIVLTEQLNDELIKINPKLNINGYDLLDLSINSIYISMISILYNFIEGLSKVIDKKNITELILHGGNPDVEFWGISLAEGERKTRFLYKRSWYLNYFAYQVFKSKLIIVWKNKTSKIFLKIIKNVRMVTIFYSKVISLLIKIIKSNHKNAKNYLSTRVNYPKVLLLIRSHIQVDPLIPIYNMMIKKAELEPVFLVFENYSNHKLVKELDKKNFEYYNLYSSLSIYKIFKIVYNLKKLISPYDKEKIVIKKIKDNEIRICSKNIIKEFLVFWIDIVVLIEALESLPQREFNNACCIINNETVGYHPATQTEWIKKKGGFSVGIQHVSMDSNLKPKISRVDTMFMMSKTIADQLSEIKPDENFMYMGPASYDLYFNTTKHKDIFKRISIFTQPDDFKKEYFQITEDVLEILNENNIDIEVNIKLHPREKDLVSFKKYEKSNSKVRVFTNEMSSSDLVKNSDLVISIHSAVIMQSIIIGTPTISVNYDEKYNIKFDFINHKVTKKVSSKEELEQCLLNLNHLDKEYYLNRNSFFHSCLDGYEGKASLKVYDFIKKEIYKDDNLRRIDDDKYAESKREK